MTLVALVLRWAVGTSTGFWTDEAEFAFIVRSPSIAVLMEFLKQNESHPPLFYLLERAWIGVVGASDLALVALPVLLGAALVPVAYVVGRRMFSPWVGVCAAILVAANPFLTHYSGYVRPYSLVPLLATVSVGLAWQGVRQGKARTWVMYAVATAGMLLTHNWAWLIFGAEVVIVAAWLLHFRRDQTASSVRGMVGAAAGVVVLYGWWLPSLLHQLRHAGHAARKGWTLESPLYPFVEFARAAVGLPGAVSLSLLALLIGAAAWKRPHASDGRPAEMLALLLCAGVPFMSVTAAGALSGRTWLTPEYCLLIPAPLALLALSRGLERLADSQSAVRFLLATITIASIYLLTWSGLANVGKSNAREFASALARKVQPSDLLLVHPGFIAPSLNYYFHGGNQQIDFPFLQRQTAIQYDRMAERVADTATLGMTLDSLRRARSLQRRVWFITRCDWFAFPRLVPRAWVEAGLITADTPLLVTRFYQFRDQLDSLYGPAGPQGITSDRSMRREILCAELYVPARSVE
jgi:4-amino-4-deoxy-L-arabinose transferase-like glycosyltransferase